MKILKYLDRQSLIRLMQTSKVFQTLVEQYLQEHFKLYHPRFVPNLDNLIATKRYFFQPSVTEIRQFLRTKGIHKMVLHNAFYCGKLFKVNGSFLSYQHEYFCEQFVIAPRVFEIYKNRYNLRIGNFTLQPQNSFLFWPGIGPPLDKIIVLPNTQAFPLPLSELACAAVSKHFTKKQILASCLPLKLKDTLFHVCPDKQRTSHANVRFLDPNDDYGGFATH